MSLFLIAEFCLNPESPCITKTIPAVRCLNYHGNRMRTASIHLSSNFSCPYESVFGIGQTSYSMCSAVAIA